MRGKVAYCLTAVDRVYGGVPKLMEDFIKFKFNGVKNSGRYYKAPAIKLIKTKIEILKSDKAVNNFILIINNRHINVENLRLAVYKNNNNNKELI